MKNFKSLMKESRAQYKAKLVKNKDEFKAEFKDFKEQLTTKIEKTNTRIEIIETRVEQSLNEQALKMENKFKEYKACLLYTSRCV